MSGTHTHDLTLLTNRLDMLERGLGLEMLAREQLDARVTALETPPELPPSTVEVGCYYLPGPQADGTNPMTAFKAKGGTLGHQWAGQNSGSLGYLDAAQAAGLGVYLELAWQTPGGCFTQADLVARMTPYLGHVALKGWMLCDEPEQRNVSPASVLQAYQWAKAIDPVRPMLVTMSWEKELNPNSWHTASALYVPACDLVGEDRYPVPYGLPGENFVRAAVQVAKAAAGSKPVVADLQAFDWNGAFGPSRPPTPAEVQAMGLAARAEGVTRLWLYQYGELVTECKPVWDGLAAITAAWRAV